MRYKIFISSVQNEFAGERRTLANYLQTDALFAKFFDTFIFEDTPAKDHSPEKVYIEEVQKSDIFILLLGKEYGTEKILTHLNLLNKGKITNAAILLFGKQPQRFFITSEVKCAHFHGTQVAKPIPFYQTYKGNLFELVDQAVDFVLSKIDLAIGTRAKSVEVPVAYEIPKEVIQEAIVNAVAHRDYDSMASVQVMLFRDRLEIRNPGRLPAELPIQDITKDHTSYPRNPLIADGLYYTKYIERMGTGIQDMVKRCVDYGLPEPKFEVQDGFVAKIFRKQGLAFDKVNEESGAIGGQTGGQTLSQSQIKIINLIQSNPKISRKELSELVKINASAVQKHIDKLKQLGIIEREGADFGGYWKITEKISKK